MKHFTLSLLFVVITQSLCAQIFTKGRGGETIADGSEITVTEFEQQAFSGSVLMDGNIFVKNDSENDVYVRIRYEIMSISNGRLQLCFPTQCVFQTSVGVYESFGNAELIEKGKSKNIFTEYMPTAEGSCKVKYTILIYKNASDFVKDGPSIVVDYVYSTNSIENICNNEDEDCKYYDILGREMTKPTKGLMLIKKNNTTRKVIIK